MFLTVVPNPGSTELSSACPGVWGGGAGGVCDRGVGLSGDAGTCGTGFGLDGGFDTCGGDGTPEGPVSPATAGGTDGSVTSSVPPGFVFATGSIVGTSSDDKPELC